MKLSELKTYAVNMAKENPTLKTEIYDFVQLAIDEIDEGGSEQHECSLALRDIEELINVMKVEESNSPGGDETVYGFSNEETYTMIVHIRNNKKWLDDAFSYIRRYNNPNNLREEFKKEIFNRGGLSYIFGKMSFGRINWFEIFDNLKEIMPKESYEELEERLALANIQAKKLFDLLYDLQNNFGNIEEEMSTIHNIKLLTDISTNEWQYQ